MGVASTLAVVLVLAAFLNVSWGKYSEVGMCYCAAFPTKNSVGDYIMTPTPQFEVRCDRMGEIHCRNMCVGMVQVAREKTRQVMSRYLKKGVKIVSPSIFSKICDGAYKYTGLTI